MDWIRGEVADGLQALLSLRLRNTPAEDMIELTADIWVQALALRVSAETIDAPRIREGFRLIFPRIREWPAPIDVIELMPPRPARAALPAPPEVAQCDSRVRLMIREFVSRFSDGHPPACDRVDDSGWWQMRLPYGECR